MSASSDPSDRAASAKRDEARLLVLAALIIASPWLLSCACFAAYMVFSIVGGAIALAVAVWMRLHGAG